jgi:hypothetical protein
LLRFLWVNVRLIGEEVSVGHATLLRSMQSARYHSMAFRPGDLDNVKPGSPRLCRMAVVDSSAQYKSPSKRMEGLILLI